MPLSARNMIAILVTIAVLLGVFFVAALYYPTNKRAKRMTKARAILEAQVEAASPTDNTGPGKNAAPRDATDMDINFFKRRNLSPSEGIPKLLEQINRMGSEMNIQFVGVKPLEEEETSEYQRFPFFIETKAAYPELVNFVYRIETGLRLSLNDLLIESDKKNPLMHRLQFTLNVFELKEDLNPSNTGGVKDDIPSPLSLERVTVVRDPFSPKREPEVAKAPEEPKEKKVATKKKPSRPKLVLMGIMEVAGSRRAIINNEVVKQGEVIAGRKVHSIAVDHVILGEGGKTYSLYLQGASPEKRGEVKR